ncbi:sensor histidine kinase [Paenibacillus sp. GSMTC-2017]|uniref:sensor histidine kinase n=1 Tax=Paenibacillus sp. GSMTC-2017 TaxID=2794350 RepID=UPI0018D8CC49|nr:sensor histidine kinase [Paenibacillus sp. GSMTC-2017]MBH5319512.1 sensor histidine kinase [Paenibacillus sp. GSMTC-2017]
MLKKLYPADQIERYLLIDIFIIISFVYLLLFVEDAVHFGVRISFVLLFLVMFYLGLWYRDWRLLVSSLTSSLLLVGLAVFAGNWVLLYGFVFADMLGRANRRATIITGIIGICGMFLLYSWLDEGNPFAIFSTWGFPIMVAQLAMPIVVYARERATLLKEKLAIANAQLERYIQEEERSRIARDLHDTLGQTLTMIKLKSELTLRLVEKNPEKAKHELHDILNTSRQALKQVRELVSDMKFVSLKKEIELSHHILHKAGISLGVTDSGLMIPLSNVAETMAALSVREAVTNIIKHSEASRCSITHEIEFDYYCIRVSDNGNGNLGQGVGNGLQSIKERMTMLQGEVDLSGEPDKGTVITLKVPLQSKGRV